MCVCMYIYIYIWKFKLMPGANPVTPVISAVFFLAGRCQGWMGRPEKVEGRGQRGRWQQDTHTEVTARGWVCELLVSLRGRARGRQLCAHPGHPGVGLVTLSHPRGSGVFAAHPSHSSGPSTSRLSQLQSCPSRDRRCHPPRARGHSSQPVPAHPWEAVPEPAMASSCPGSDFVVILLSIDRDFVWFL